VRAVLQLALAAFGPRLNRDIAWNLGSFAVLAAAGIVTNVVIATQQGAAALGVFNQVYAIYIVLSQILVLGVHYSVLRHCAEHAEDSREVARLVAAALAIAIAAGLGGALLAAALAPSAAAVLDSPGVAEGLLWTAGALLLFPVNKVLLAAANGLRAMRLFAVAQATRYLAIAGFVVLVAWRGWEPGLDAAAFFVAEALTLMVAAGGLLGGVGLRLAAPGAEWVRRHLHFGARGMMSGLFLELNSRVDVLMVGYFLSDHAVGVYSFAAMLVDGFIHLLAVLRNNFNPLLVRFVVDQDLDGLRRFARRSFAVIYPAGLAAAFAICAAFWALVELAAPGRGLQEGWPVLLIMLGGLWLWSGLMPFDNLLLQAGYPGHQTLQQAVVIAVNLAASAALIPTLGIEGAALAAALSYGCGVAVLVALARRKLGLRLIGPAEPR
jgi:O-antigen/teichoic acid export membrane protein